MRLYLCLFLIIVSTFIYGQNSAVDSSNYTKFSQQDLSDTFSMLKDLSIKGIDLVNDSLVVSEEFNRLRTDEAYYNLVYPEIYTWEQAIKFIQAKDLKKAFWYLINLYPSSEKNKELVITSVITYDTLLRMDVVLINTFYTYAFSDPELSSYVENKREITRPDILENKLRTVKELVQCVLMYREKQQNSK